jgi:hypothetical protein
MKYIITESRLDKVVFKYLDSKLDGIELKKGISDGLIFAFPNEEYGLMRLENTGELYTNYDISEEIGHMFSMDMSDVLKVIGRYVESRYNLKVVSNSDNRWISLKLLKVDSY